MSTRINGVPVVEVVRTTINKDEVFIFYCPVCDMTHTHGPQEGHRIAHCYKDHSHYNETGYYLKEVKWHSLMGLSEKFKN